MIQEQGYKELEESDVIAVEAEKNFTEYGRDPHGYGRKIAMRYRIKCKDSRWHRVYAICFSNTATLYIVYQKNPFVVCENVLNAHLHP